VRAQPGERLARSVGRAGLFHTRVQMLQLVDWCHQPPPAAAQLIDG
jgi:hypothetical protein